MTDPTPDYDPHAALETAFAYCVHWRGWEGWCETIYVRCPDLDTASDLIGEEHSWTDAPYEPLGEDSGWNDVQPDYRFHGVVEWVEHDAAGRVWLHWTVTHTDGGHPDTAAQDAYEDRRG